MKRYSHALVVGGSGMLAGLCRELLNVSDAVSVLARDIKRIQAISPALNPIICDYNKEASLNEALASSVTIHGAPDLIIAWIHHRSPALRRRFAKMLKPDGTFLQVLASEDDGDPAMDHPLEETKSAAHGLPLTYQSVVLGFVINGTGARWLTHDEISQGVWKALKSGSEHAVFGVLEPWHLRPA